MATAVTGAATQLKDLPQDVLREVRTTVDLVDLFVSNARANNVKFKTLKGIFETVEVADNLADLETEHASFTIKRTTGGHAKLVEYFDIYVEGKDPITVSIDEFRKATADLL